MEYKFAAGLDLTVLRVGALLLLLEHTVPTIIDSGSLRAQLLAMTRFLDCAVWCNLKAGRGL